MTEFVLPLDGQSMADSLQSLSAALQPGDEQTWTLRAGSYPIDPALELGRPDASLTLRGRCRLRCRRGLRIQGKTVRIEDLELRLGIGGPAPGQRTLLDVDAELADLADLRVDGEAVSDATGIRVRAADARLSMVEVAELGGADCTGVDVVAEDALLIQVTVHDLTATGAAVGVKVEAERATVTRMRVLDVDAQQDATGVLARAQEALVAVDVDVRRLTTPTEAASVLLVSGGSLALRGCTVRDVSGLRAQGVLLLASGALEVLAADVRRVVGGTGGACGVRLLAPPGTEPLSLEDLEVVGVVGGDPLAPSTPSWGWDDWVQAQVSALASGAALDPLPPNGPEVAADAVGLAISALVTEETSWVDETDPGALLLDQLRVQAVAGSALVVGAGLRDVQVRGAELTACVAPGYLEGERLELAWCTVHLAERDLMVGPCDLTLANLLLTELGPSALELDPDCVLQSSGAVFGTVNEWPVEELGPLPYVDAGPASVPPELLAGALPPPFSMDLTLTDGGLHEQAVAVVGEDDAPPFVGATPPLEPLGCILRDPAPPPTEANPPAEPQGPLLDTTARDAPALLQLMMERADVVLPEWTERGAADLATMLLELVAHQLDRIAYAQERATAEGFLETAQLRRSVEDHVRLLDYTPDPGLAATAMIRVRLDRLGEVADRIEAAAESPVEAGASDIERVTGGASTLRLPAGSLIGPSTAGEPAIFETEMDLDVDPALDELGLVEDIERGASSAEIQGDWEGLKGRWMLLDGGRDRPLHVIRVTRAEVSTDATVLHWDPRRPAPVDYPSSESRFFGNLVPAHHGIPLEPLGVDTDVEATLSDEQDDPLGWLEPFREQLSFDVDGSERELDLPLHPIAYQAAGWPFPGERREGVPQLEIAVDGETWARVEHLGLADPADRVFVLRAGRNGGASIRFGNGENGAALPARQLPVTIGMRLALGSPGNVGAGVLDRVLAFGPSATFDALLTRLQDTGDAELWLRRMIVVDNPLPAVGGRPPESLERMRYDAPRAVRDRLSAVVPDDYERLLEQLDDVRGARARILDVGLRQVVRVTLLLGDEDVLDDDERLRRWAEARQQLEDIRLLGFDVEIQPPTWVPLDLDVVVDAVGDWNTEQVRQAVIEAIEGDGGLLDPDSSGLGGDVMLDALYRAILATPGVAAAQVKRFRRLERDAREYLEDGRIPIGAEEVAVIHPPYGDADTGVLTVTVCGGRA